MSNEFRYDAFLSYSHAESALAERLSRRIRRYRPPRALRLPRRKLVVFRDVERLTASADLSDALLERVHASRKLVLLCSPAAAESAYVEREVAAFLEKRGPRSLVLLLAGGEPGAGYPPSVRAAMDEPLFIDLRRPSRRWSRRGAFRRASLRLLAAILEVDFTDLAREDDVRRRRRRSAAVLATLLAAFLAGSVYLVRSVPADHWEPVPLPTGHGDSPVMPVRRFAVSRAQPATVLYELHDAYHVSQRPDRPAGANVTSSGLDVRAFRDRVGLHLDGLEGLDEADRPVATVTFAPGPGDEGPVAGEMRIFAYRDTSGEPWFERSFSWVRADRDGNVRRLVLPRGPASVAANPLSLDPWPIDELFAARLVEPWQTLAGTFTDHLDGTAVAVTYEVVDLFESFVEFDDGMLFERAIVASDPDVEVTFEGERIPLRDVEREVTWSDVEAWPEWATWEPPERVVHERVRVRSSARPEDRAALAAALAPAVGDDAALARLLAGLDVAWDDPEAERRVVVTRRPLGAGAIDVVSVHVARFNEIAFKLSSRHHVHAFRRAGAGDGVRIAWPGAAPEAEVLDVTPLDEAGLVVLLRVSPGGLIRTTDGGTTWHDFSVGRGEIERAIELETVVVGDAEGRVVHTLAFDYDDETGRGGSALFRLRGRDWIERWRAGLITRLGGEAR